MAIFGAPSSTPRGDSTIYKNVSWRQFLKKFKDIFKKIHILVHIYFDILMHICGHFSSIVFQYIDWFFYFFFNLIDLEESTFPSRLKIKKKVTKTNFYF